MVNSKQIDWNLEQLLVPVTCGNRNDCEIFHVPKWKQVTIEKELFCGSNVRDCLGSQSVATENFCNFSGLCKLRNTLICQIANYDKLLETKWSDTIGAYNFTIMIPYSNCSRQRE